jgi:hypothetical protein
LLLPGKAANLKQWFLVELFFFGRAGQRSDASLVRRRQSADRFAAGL